MVRQKHQRRKTTGGRSGGPGQVQIVPNLGWDKYVKFNHM